MNDYHPPMIGGHRHPSDIRENYSSENISITRSGRQLSKKLALIRQLRLELPATFTRQYICEKLGGLISPKTLSNLDSKGEGPMSKVALGRRVSYERDDFLDWLEKRVKNI